MMCSVTRDSRLWFMTELCSDGDLNRYILKIQESKTAAENSLINAQICIQMLDGLKFLHHVSASFRNHRMTHSFRIQSFTETSNRKIYSWIWRTSCARRSKSQILAFPRWLPRRTRAVQAHVGPITSWRQKFGTDRRKNTKYAPLFFFIPFKSNSGWSGGCLVCRSMLPRADRQSLLPRLEE